MESRRIVRFVVIAAIILGAVLLFSFIFHGNGTPQKTKPSPQVKIAVPRGSNSTANAVSSWSCPDLETVYDTNYYNQLYVSWATWNKIVTSLPNQDISAGPLINYQYNNGASHAYGLYASSMRNNNCTPAIAAPAILRPAVAPDGSFSPAGFNPDVPVNCNVPLAITALNSANGQFALAQDNVQGHLDDWVQRSNNGIFTLADQQAGASFAVQLYTAAFNLAQIFQNEAGNLGC
jgi:hypothetical protein